jgi:hypothetical protein
MKLKKLINEDDTHYIKNKKYEFILDMKEEHDVFNQDGSLYMKLPRYAFWANKGKNKPEVVESSNDLEYLMKKYDVPQDKVLTLEDV